MPVLVAVTRMADRLGAPFKFSPKEGLRSSRVKFWPDTIPVALLM